MRILTVRQPWAWAIIHGGKDVENRVRNLAGSYRGPVALHAARAWDKDWRERAGAPTLAARIWAADFPDLDFGAIIGVVDLVDVHDAHGPHQMTCGGLDESYGPVLCSPWAEPDRWHLALANPRPLSEPIPYKGALGLRTVPAELQARIEAAL